jgi:hypothetical protein
MLATHAAVMEDWSRIRDPSCPIMIEQREQPVPDSAMAPLLDQAPFAIRAEGDIPTVLAQLAALPDALRVDAAALAQRFMALMGVDAVRVRVEGVTTNACKKVHMDYTDVRLITTYSGPGTDYAPHGDADCCLERVPTGAVALFKGHSFAPDHAPCLHRSPPIEGSGERRLVLVIDTPLKSSPPD